MRVLVVGSGGREHALSWKLAQEAEVFAGPGNPGIESVAQCRPLDPADHESVLAVADSIAPELIVVGPEAPLIAGLADRLREAGYAVLGPGREGSNLEGSKAFAKDLMRDAGVPTADYATFVGFDQALEYAASRFNAGIQVAVKASGPALGKGVVVCENIWTAEDVLRRWMIHGELGEAGRAVVVEDRLVGREVSLLTLCNESGHFSLPPARDYKRAHDGDQGPNTGGMGSFAPVPWAGEDFVREVERRVGAPTLAALRSRGSAFRGVLFTGLMVRDDTPYVLEFNVRFGDPETQSVLPILGAGFAEALLRCAKGVPIPEIEVRDRSAVAVVLASEGYPEAPKVGVPLIVSEPKDDRVTVFHAGTKMTPSGLVTSGGRVAAVAAHAANLAEAREAAYRNLSCVQFEGAQWRKDIAEEPRRPALQVPSGPP
jgi:phosphoribosylamine--glycine ligase